MSHVVTAEFYIDDLEALRLAAERLGMELVLNQTEYKWYGRHVGDYPLPVGFSEEDLGKCEHALRLKERTDETYEVGVCKRRDGKPGYTLQWDFFAGGYGLMVAVGENCTKVRGMYAIEAAKRNFMKNGIAVREVAGPNGFPKLVAAVY